jgi:hypothetical protein
MSEEITWSDGDVDSGLLTVREKTAGIVPKATVQGILHFHLSDGTIKDVPFVGEVQSEPESKGNENGDHSSR